MTAPLLATLRRHRDTVMTRAQYFTTVSRFPTRRSHPSYGELFCLALGLIVAGYLIGWVHAASVFAEMVR